MEKITSLVSAIKHSLDSDKLILPSLKILPGDGFGWNYEDRIISYDASDPKASEFLMHELGHALLKHSTYRKDVELLEMERAAWDKATDISSLFKIHIDNKTIDESLDTYKDWLHNRSLCPRCEATGIQIGPKSYSCLACHQLWTVNEARTCQLRRYSNTKKRPS